MWSFLDEILTIETSFEVGRDVLKRDRGPPGEDLQTNREMFPGN